MSRISILFAMALVLAGCGGIVSGNPYARIAVHDATPEQTLQVEDGLSEWNARAGTHLTLSLDGNGDVDLYVSADPWRTAARLGLDAVRRDEAGQMGCYDWGCAGIVSTVAVRAVTLHEMGHYDGTNGHLTDRDVARWTRNVVLTGTAE
jgi:uncharacterized protein YceK